MKLLADVVQQRQLLLVKLKLRQNKQKDHSCLDDLFAYFGDLFLNARETCGAYSGKGCANAVKGW